MPTRPGLYVNLPEHVLVFAVNVGEKLELVDGGVWMDL